MKEFVKFKNNTYYIRAVQDSAVAAVTDDNAESQDMYHHHDVSQGASVDNLIIKVSNVPPGLPKATLEMILENKRYGGGETRRVEFCEDEQCAFVEFVEHAGESSEPFCCVYCCLCEDEQCVQLWSLLSVLVSRVNLSVVFIAVCVRMSSVCSCPVC